MLLIDLLRALRNDLWSPESRFDYVNAILKDLPGEVGMLLRSRVIPRYFESAGTGILVCPGARFNMVGKIKVGNRVWIGVDNHLQASAGLTIGDNTILGPGVKIWTVNHRFDSRDRPIAEQGWDFAAVSIGANVWVGANVFIMPGVQIQDGCIISADAVLGIKHYPPYSIIAGHPARVIGRRTEETTSGSKPSTGELSLLDRG